MKLSTAYQQRQVTTNHRECREFKESSGTAPNRSIRSQRPKTPNVFTTPVRGLTLRELATIQGFPYRHEFPLDLPESKIQKQIGNAVPASFMKLLYEEAIKTLRESDGRGVEDGRTRDSAYEVS